MELLSRACSTRTPVAIFSNYLSIKKQLDLLPAGKDIVINLSETRLVDHTVMGKLQEFRRSYDMSGGRLQISGLDHHKAASAHALSARRLALT